MHGASEPGNGAPLPEPDKVTLRSSDRGYRRDMLACPSPDSDPTVWYQSLGAGGQLKVIRLLLRDTGFRVGRQLAERYTANRARTGEPLEVIKFICKEFWVAVFRKQVDNLRTNHRGTFVLKDQSFRWLAKLSVDPVPPSNLPQNGGLSVHPAAEPARDYLVLPCAMIRGALVHLGVECSVTADPSALPACDFTITIKNR